MNLGMNSSSLLETLQGNDTNANHVEEKLEGRVWGVALCNISSTILPSPLDASTADDQFMWEKQLNTTGCEDVRHGLHPRSPFEESFYNDKERRRLSHGSRPLLGHESPRYVRLRSGVAAFSTHHRGKSCGAIWRLVRPMFGAVNHADTGSDTERRLAGWSGAEAVRYLLGSNLPGV